MRNIFENELEDYTKNGLTNLEIGKIIYIALFDCIYNKDINEEDVYNKSCVSILNAKSNVAKYSRCVLEYINSKK